MLDLKRAHTYYLRKTEQFKKTESSKKFQLFLTIIARIIGLQVKTFSSWIVKTIQKTYKSSDELPPKVKDILLEL